MNQMNRDYQKEVKDKDFNIEEFRKKYKMINKHTILALLICQVVLFGLGLKVVKHVDITLPLLAVIGIYLAFYLVLFFSFKNMMIKGIKENYLRHGIFLIMGIAFTLIVLDIPEMIFIMVLLIPYVYKS
ncbi:hypothetical protein QY97_03851 [Bacillus thermotolerans]|nr:hypothetical protein QY97_03851 [Bacillus thermotolerans]KKB36123.1 hypothetical protein QY96_03492 [Bacillus thermotolerans]